MFTQRSSIWMTCGYSSSLARLKRMLSRMSFSASGSIQVVTNDARFWSGFMSRLSWSCTNW